MANMKRKLVKQGGSAMTITLPFKWIQRFGLEAGDEVDVEEKDNKLFITTYTEAEGERKDIDISEQKLMIKRILGALYKAGYDEFNVQFETADQFALVQEVVREEFIGFEIVEQRRKSILIKRISKIEHGEFDIMLKRMFMIIKLMGEEGLEAAKTNDKELLKMIALRDKDVNKIADYCRRIINKRGLHLDTRPAPLYFIVEQLEKVGDIYRDLCKYYYTNKINKETESIYKEINAFYAEFYELFLKFDLAALDRFGKNREKLKKTIEDALVKGKDAVPLSHLNMFLSSVFDMNGPLMAVKL